MIRFGVQIPQEGVPFSTVLQHARVAERLGYDSVFIPDHLRAVGVPTGSPCYEGWTTLTGVVMGTERIRAGNLVLCEAFRNPAWLANAAATLDAMSGGRLILGLGAGWYEDEFHAYGFDWRSGGERVARLEEALCVIEAMWRGEGFQGRYYRAEGTADCPSAHPPIWVGGQGRTLLEVVARHADAWNSPPMPVEEVATRAERLRALTDRPIEITYEGPVWIDEDEERLRQRLERNRRSDNPIARRYAEIAIAGTPSQVTKRLKEYAAAGVSHVVCHFGRADNTKGTELFARAVMPAFR